MSQTPNQTGVFSAGQRPNMSQKSANQKNRDVAEWFDTSVFSLAPAYTFGNAPRTLPSTRQPGLKTADLSVFKNFTIREFATLSFHLEAFNAFNTTQFGPAASVEGSSSFGAISSTATGTTPRDIQLALHLSF